MSDSVYSYINIYLHYQIISPNYMNCLRVLECDCVNASVLVEFLMELGRTIDVVKILWTHLKWYGKSKQTKPVPGILKLSFCSPLDHSFIWSSVYMTPQPYTTAISSLFIRENFKQNPLSNIFTFIWLLVWKSNIQSIKFHIEVNHIHLCIIKDNKNNLYSDNSQILCFLFLLLP